LSSYIDFGPANKANWKPGELPVWVSMEDPTSSNWQNKVDGFYLGDAPNFKYDIAAKKAVIDFNYPKILVPQE